MTSESRNVRALRNLFAEKNAPVMSGVGIPRLRESISPNTIRIPRPIIAHKPTHVVPSDETNIEEGRENPSSLKITKVIQCEGPPKRFQTWPEPFRSAKQDPRTDTLKKNCTNLESETIRNETRSPVSSMSSLESSRQESRMIPCSRPRQVCPQSSPNRSELVDGSEKNLATTLDNYVCRSQRFVWQQLPSLKELGPPPVKPVRPDKLVLRGRPPRTENQHSKFDVPTTPWLDEELYGDTGVPDEPSSPIPEYTEDEEYQLYADTETPTVPDRPRSLDQLYQDSTLCEEMYQEMPCLEAMHTAEDRGQKKEREKLKAAVRKTQRKFGMTGLEEPLQTGLVKFSCRGGRLDLTVKKGEILYILRMENNPPGKWLVRNNRGQVGYAELTNIEVDADSVRVVMVSQVQSNLNKDMVEKSPHDDEAIYEETF